MSEQVLARVALSMALIPSISCLSPKREVVIYTSVEKTYAEPVFAEFSRRSGIEVHPVFDAEASQTTDLAGRFLASQERERADVFWNGEFAQTMRLKERGALTAHVSRSTQGLPARYVDPQSCWAAVGGRCRVLLIQSRLAPPKVRASIETLLDPEIPSHRVGVAYPLTGTAATHAAALYAVQGAESSRWYFERLRARAVVVLDGNLAVSEKIAGWQLAIGLTDSNAACKAAGKNGPVTVALPDQDTIGTLLIPSTVALVKGSPHPPEGRALVDYLLSAETEKRLIEAGYFQFTLRDVMKPQGCLEGSRPKLMNVSFDDVYRQLEASHADMQRIFVQ